MAGIRKQSEAIRQFLLDQVEEHPLDLARLVGETFGISRQAVNRHIQTLIADSFIEAEGMGRKRRYRLRPLLKWEHIYPLNGTLAEDVVWRKDIAPRLGDLPRSVIDIWHYGFTEMLNNAIDHSEGRTVTVVFTKWAGQSEIIMHDDGVGIFRKIQGAFGLEDERHAVLELAKGKLTTDPANHTGEGIFFASRVFDHFDILSGNVYFSHEFNHDEDWISEALALESGTTVLMKIKDNARQTLKTVFDQFASGDEDFRFTKTVVPVRLAQYGDEMLVSRSQAKRLLVRIDKFKTVILNFTGVGAIGQAFADEIFRVFAREHPNIELVPVAANPDVQRMISRASHGNEA